MPCFAANHHRVLFTGEVLLYRQFRIELLPQLIKVNCLQVGAEFDFTLLRLQFAQNQLEQGGFAYPVGSDDTDPVTANDGR